MRVIVSTILTLACMVSAPAMAASSGQENTISGVISHVDRDLGTITVLNEATGERRTYFLDQNSVISSRGQPISVDRLRRGQSINLRYRATDTGRSVLTLMVPSPSDIVSLAPITITERGTLTGVVTGVRPQKRTITVRDDATKRRTTFAVADDVRIVKNGRQIQLYNLRRDDQVSVGYQMTEQGLMIVARPVAEKPAVVVSAEPTPQPTVLPKTASPYPLLGLVGLLALLGGLLTRGLRQRVIKSA